MADQYYDFRLLVPRGDRIYEASGSGAEPYLVDMNYEKCTCPAWALNRNKSKTNPAFEAKCKHTKAAVEYEAYNPPEQEVKRAKEDTKQKEQQEEAEREFNKVKMVEQAKRELAKLREEV